MNLDTIMTVIRAPHTSEKSVMLAETARQIVFKVQPSSTKREIASAVERFFEVKVKNVTVVNQKGKTKRFGQRSGKRADTKKAYVTLHEGYDINFATTE